MARPKVLLYSYRDNEIDDYERLVRESSANLDLMVCRSQNDLGGLIEEVEIIFGVHLPAEVYTKAKNLRWIQSTWAGVEGLLKSPVPDDVIITKPWGVFGKFLAHYVFGNLLAQKINLQGGLKSQAECKWQPYRIELLQDLTMGIAGLGDVATETAQIARAFGMKVWALNSDGREHKLADRSFSTQERKAFVAGSDVLVLTMPSTAATREMFNHELLSQMQSHAWIINVGRGALIQDSALIELLENKRIAGAILDVFHEEPLPAEHPYWRLPNCIVTPHIAGPSLPADITSCFLENFTRYQSGQPLLGLVDRKRGY